jgi:serpin B
VLHKAFIAVNEAGTEAAAATAVVVGRVSAPEPAEIALDRPFLYFIVDRPTGELLFLGRVLDPSA